MKQETRSLTATSNQATTSGPDPLDELRKVSLASRSLSVQEGIAAWNQAVARYTVLAAERLDAARDPNAAAEPQP